MKVLVTGATGFIGRHIMPILLERGHQITVLARNENKAREFDWYPYIRFISFDILDTLACIPPDLGENDAIIHLAWSGLPNYKSLFHFERNLPADYRFLKSVIEAGIKQVLVSGTCMEYGMQSGFLSEDMPTHPANPYALAKDTLRKFLEALHKETPFNLQWARLFYIYGKGQNPNSLLAQLDRAIDKGDEVFNMSGGEQLRDYLPVTEAVVQLTGLLEHAEKHGPVNICSGTAISILELVMNHIADRGAEIKLNPGYYPYPVDEPMVFWGKKSVDY